MKSLNHSEQHATGTIRQLLSVQQEFQRWRYGKQDAEVAKSTPRGLFFVSLAVAGSLLNERREFEQETLPRQTSADRMPSQEIANSPR